MRRILLILVLIGIPNLAAADLQRGLEAAEREDFATAAREFHAAAEQGDANAQYLLAVMYSEGQGVSKNESEAALWCRRASMQGHAPAQFYLGVMYQEGRGVHKNNTEAARWYRLAAKQGNPRAQTMLAVMYAEGEGVQKDQAEAARLFRQAADQGYMEAQFNLGLLYGLGRGVPKNDTEAGRWYRRAAEQGQLFAQNNLGALYTRGEGVPRNLVLAYKWTSLAAAQGYEAARGNLAKQERLMTRAQIDEAQRLAADFRPRKEELGSYASSAEQAAPSPPARLLISNDTVRRIQTHLTTLGYVPGPIDGVAGPDTIRAIRAFQRDAGIEPDGVASGTLEALLATKIAR